MPKNAKPRPKTSISLRTNSHGRASIAASIIGENLLDFVSRAADDRALPILRKHGVKLPDHLATAD